MEYGMLINQLSANFNKSDLIHFDFEKSEYFIGAPLRRYFYDLLGFEDSNIIQEFESFLIDDLKMMLLADSLIWLNGYFAKKRNRKGSSNFVKDFYYCDETFIEKLGSFIDIFKINEGNILLDILNAENGMLYKKLLPTRMPRLVFTWFGFALCRHYADLTINPERKTINVVRGKVMSLKNIGNKIEPDTQAEKVVNQNQEDTILIKNILSRK
jgi:hypothetical protein